MVKSVHNEIVALDRLFELAPRLAGAMEHGLAERKLTLARAHVIWLLGQDGPLVQRALSEILDVTPRYVTGLVDALEEQGLVTRGRHPTDRRATLVALTERGRAAAAEMERGRRELARSLFADVPAADLAAFVAVAERVLGRLGELE